MASGFATVSGTVLAAFISFGAEASHLITSTVMAAPATLAYSKLVYPETEKSELDSNTIQMEKSYVSAYYGIVAAAILTFRRVVLARRSRSSMQHPMERSRPLN